MTIEARNIGKRFENNWIFRHVSFTLTGGNIYAFTGPNGSGKSTLLKILAGFSTPTEGEILYSINEGYLNNEFLFGNISFSAPYMDLIEEFSLAELLNLHKSLRGLIVDHEQFANEIAIKLSASLKTLSSGTMQRLKLALALFTPSMFYLLDEPVSNMDAYWIEWYRKTIEKLMRENKLIVVASNFSPEYEGLAETVFDMKDFSIK
ncbi:MAG: ATP-binding cassette domain-containing protein [Chitinophagales bacterium]|nr:ATP-binding cassette domain-containing protein [Chitinophagales bacterium]